MMYFMHFRPLFFMFVAFVLGVLSSVLISWNVSFFIVPVACFSLGIALSVIVYKRKCLRLVATCCIGLCFVLGMVGTFCSETLLTANNLTAQSVRATAYVSDIKKGSYGYRVVVEGFSIDGKEVDGVFFTEENAETWLGKEIRLEGNAKPNTWQLKDVLQGNMPPTQDVMLYNVEVFGVYEVNHSNDISWILYERLQTLFGDNVAGTATAMLFGDKAFILDDVQANYQASGIAHLLAVSGLHVGFVCALLAFILKRCTKNGKLSFIITAVVLLLYCFLCGFSASVMRASVMTMLLLFAPLVGRQYDPLSSISFAGLILCVINPFNLFHIGWELSFAAVFGIFTIAPLLQKVLRPVLGKALGATISISLSTQLATLPLQMLYFSTAQPFAILANFVAIPLATIAFTALLITLPLLFIPYICYIGQVPYILFVFLNTVANFFGGLSFYTFTIHASGWICVPYYGTMFVCSEYMFVRKSTKWCWFCIGLSCVLLILLL